MPGHYRSLRKINPVNIKFNIILQPFFCAPKTLMTENDRALMTRCLLTICIFSLTLGRLFSQDSGKLNSSYRKLLHPTTLFCTFAPESKASFSCTRFRSSQTTNLGLNKRQTPVVNDDQNKGKKWGSQEIEISTKHTLFCLSMR